MYTRPLTRWLPPVAMTLCSLCAAPPVAAQATGSKNSTAEQAAARTPRATAASFFGLDKSWDVHLTLAAADLKKMYPKGRPTMGLSQRGRYPYVPATIEIAGHGFAKIGLRFKGNSTFWSTSGSLKRSFKLDFNRFEKGQSFLGLTKLNLQNNATDASQIREAVAYEVYRALDIPASRTAFARVFLTVQGSFERSYVGNYTIVEQVDRRFLKRRFGAKAGLIVKPEGRVMPYLGETWHEDYEATYHAKTPTLDAHTQPLIAMARLTAEADPETFAARIESALDVDEFLRYAATTLYLANLDSPFMIAHNFYMVVPSKAGKVLWVPWDLNLSLGGFRMGGSNQTGVSVFRGGSVPLFDKVLAIPRFKKLYKQHLRRLIEGPGSSETLASLLATARNTTNAAIAAEADRADAIVKVANDRSGLGFGFGRGMSEMFRAPSPDDFVAARPAAVSDQLESGTAPARRSGGLFGMGGLGSFGRRTTKGRDDLDTVLRRTLRRSRLVNPGEDGLSSTAFNASIDRLFARIDQDQSESLKRAELARILRAQRGQDFAPSQARGLLKQLDKDRSRTVTKDEWRTAFRTSWKSWDQNQDQRLSAEELAK